MINESQIYPNLGKNKNNRLNRMKRKSKRLKYFQSRNHENSDSQQLLLLLHPSHRWSDNGLVGRYWRSAWSHWVHNFDEC